MAKPDASGWVSVRVRKSDIERMQVYAALCHAKLSPLLADAIKLWDAQLLPDLMKPFEKKD